MLIHAEVAINQLTVLSSLRSRISTRHVERSINSSANARSRNGAHLSLDTQLHFTHSSGNQVGVGKVMSVVTVMVMVMRRAAGRKGGDCRRVEGVRRLYCISRSGAERRYKRMRSNVSGAFSKSAIYTPDCTRGSAWKFECLSEASIELTIVDCDRPVRKVGVRHPRHVFVSMFHCRHGAASGILLVDLSSRNERKVEFRNAMIGVPHYYTLSIHSLSDFIKDIEAELVRFSRESKREKKRAISAG
ncbi:hypothetical protein V1478_012033 [Vespula squamosa]|uniref:Uncharacterized protein n=1 Tax=Vespula squamosa TaxID=30214 RepID=A0ABD2AC11_VESSQ